MMMMMRRKTQSVKFPYLNIMLHTDLSQVLLEFTDIYDFNAMSSPFQVRRLLSHGGARVTGIVRIRCHVIIDVTANHRLSSRTFCVLPVRQFVVRSLLNTHTPLQLGPILYRPLAGGTVHCAGSATYQICFRLAIPNPNPNPKP